MKSVVLFILIATLSAVHCEQTSIVDVESPKNDNEMLLQIIKSIFCNAAEKIDINSIIINEEIMERFSEKSIQEIQQLYCFEESTTLVATEFANAFVNSDYLPSIIQPNMVLPDTATNNEPSDNTLVAMKVANTDANTGFARSTVQPDAMVVPYITTTINAPLVVTQASCQLPFIDPKNCDLACFKQKKLDVMKCVKNHFREYKRQHKQYLLGSLGLDETMLV